MTAFARFLWPGPVLFFAFWVGLQSLGGKFLRDPGMYWHTRTGEKILAEGFLRSDPYTFTFPNTWWVPYQWLGEVGMAKLHEISGLDSLLVVSTAMVAALFAWLATRFLRTGLHPIFAFGLILLAMSAASSHFHVRPHLFTLLSMGITMAAILAYDRGRIGLGEMLGLVPLFALWTNIHGGVMGGISTLGLAIAGWYGAALLRWPSPVDRIRTAVGIGAIGVACLLTVFASPYGTDMPRTWMLITGMPKLPELIQEHGRFNLHDPLGWPVLLLMGVYVGVLAGLRERPRVAWLLPICWFVQAMLRVRHGSIFAIAGTLAIIDLWPRTAWAQWLSVHRPDVYQPREDGGGSDWKGIAIAGVIGVSLALSVQAAKLPVPLFGPGCAQLDPQHWPVELIDVLQDHEPRYPGQPNTLFNDYIDGAFVLYHAPGYRVFVDDRCEVFGDDWLADLVEASGRNTDSWLDRWQQQYGPFGFALTRLETPFDEYFRSRPGEWECLKRGTTAAFYRRR